jgi:phage-related protein
MMIDNRYVNIYLEIGADKIEIGRDKRYGLVGIEGIESSTYDIQSVNTAGYDGEIVNRKRILGRVITIDADYRNQALAHMEREYLIHFFNPKEKGQLVVDYMGVRRKINFYLRSFLCPRENINQRLKFAVILYCPNPYFQDINQYRENIAGKLPLFTSRFAIPKGKRFTMSAKQFRPAVSVTNKGDKEVGLEIELRARGRVINPCIMNLTTGEQIKLMMTVEAGEIVKISTVEGNKSILLERQREITNINNLLDRTSTFFYLRKGENIIKFSADDGTANLEVYPRFYSEYLGI